MGRLTDLRSFTEAWERAFFVSWKPPSGWHIAFVRSLEAAVEAMRLALSHGTSLGGQPRPASPSSTGCEETCKPTGSPLRNRKLSHLPDGVQPRSWRSAAFDEMCGGLCSSMPQRASAARFVQPVAPREREGVASFMHAAVSAVAATAAGAPVIALPEWAPQPPGRTHSSATSFNLSDALGPACGYDWASGVQRELPRCSGADCEGPPGTKPGRLRSAFLGSGAMGEREVYSNASIALVLHGGVWCEPLTQPSWCHDGTWCTAQCGHAQGSNWPYPMPPELLPACAIGAIFDPMPSLTPDFAALRTALAHPSTLSIALYLRTGHTEGFSERPRTNQSSRLDAMGMDAMGLPTALGARNTWPIHLRYAFAATTLCALQLEERWAPGFEDVVWFVASDHPAVRQAVVDEFGEARERGRRLRRVLGTKSLGHHSKPKRRVVSGVSGVSVVSGVSGVSGVGIIRSQRGAICLPACTATYCPPTATNLLLPTYCCPPTIVRLPSSHPPPNYN